MIFLFLAIIVDLRLLANWYWRTTNTSTRLICSPLSTSLRQKYGNLIRKSTLIVFSNYSSFPFSMSPDLISLIFFAGIVVSFVGKNRPFFPSLPKHWNPDNTLCDTMYSGCMNNTLQSTITKQSRDAETWGCVYLLNCEFFITTMFVASFRFREFIVFRKKGNIIWSQCMCYHFQLGWKQNVNYTLFEAHSERVCSTSCGFRAVGRANLVRRHPCVCSGLNMKRTARKHSHTNVTMIHTFAHWAAPSSSSSSSSTASRARDC